MGPWSYFIVGVCGGFLVVMLGWDFVTYKARQRRARERLDRIVAMRRYDHEGLWPWERDQ